MFDDFDTEIQCEEFYTDEEVAGVCEVDDTTDCIDCGACNGQLYEDDDVCDGILADPTVNIYQDGSTK